MILDLQNPREFRPELLPRRGELIAWLLALLVGATWLILLANDARFTVTALILFIFLAFTAVGTSLGSWMDRRSILRLDSRGIAFRNGLRDVELAWDEVRSIRVIPVQAGARRVQVLGEKAHFEFRTLTTLSLKGEVKGRSGFPQGAEIIETVVDKAGLQARPSDSPYTYYARD